jgi:hypothetical protein
MRVVAVGCEYSGVTTLLEGLMKWGDARGIHHHLDDHFSIPDRQFLSREDRDAMVALSPILKERFQRFQVVYHVRLLQKYEHILLGGFHIEETIYGPRYYYPGRRVSETRQLEAEMPADTLLVLLTAQPDVLRRRLRQSPHEYAIVPEADVEEVQAQFDQEFRASWIKHKMRIDTSALTAEQLLQQFLTVSLPHLNTRDALTRLMQGAG